MISSILVLNQKGFILINRNYKGDVTRPDIIAFVRKIVYAKETGECPVQIINGCSFLHVQINDLIFVATTKANANAMMVMKFLHTFIDLLRVYMKNNVSEESVKRNYVLMYELMDEMADHGIPQVTNIDVLKKYITQGGAKAADLTDEAALKKLTVQVTGNTSWRPDNIKYKINMLTMDIQERVNCLVSTTGQPLRADVQGVVNLKTRLSGMPECQLTFNDRLSVNSGAEKKNGKVQSVQSGVSIDDVAFHQCVRVSKFESDRSITFVPPDGAFELMTYRVTENVDLPFRVIPQIVERSRTLLEVSLRVKAQFPKNLSAKNLVIKIPVPRNALKLNILSLTAGKATLEAQKHEIVWRIRKLNGECEATISGEVSLASTVVEAKWIRPPITFDFSIKSLLPSGLKVRSLKVQEKANYDPIIINRSGSQAGQYHHRI